MNQDQIKELLLQIEDSQLEFTVTMTGKESKKVNGLYKPDTCEILLHNKNFSNDNQLIYTAIHEYTHHLLNEEQIARCGTGSRPRYTRAHTNMFWARFHGLLTAAEQKGIYKIGLENAPELAALTETIRKKYLEQNGILMQEFGQMLIKAHELCQDAGIRYEDYIDRVLCLPRTAAASITKVSTARLDPSMGYENMKMVASIGNEDKRKQAEQEIMAGQSPDSVRFMMKKKAAETDEKTRLEKEKKRLEKTISQLSARLEQVEESLANL